MVRPMRKHAIADCQTRNDLFNSMPEFGRRSL
jgi:hypothetical protein